MRFLFGSVFIRCGFVQFLVRFWFSIRFLLIPTHGCHHLGSITNLRKLFSKISLYYNFIIMRRKIVYSEQGFISRANKHEKTKLTRAYTITVISPYFCIFKYLFLVYFRSINRLFILFQENVDK